MIEAYFDDSGTHRGSKVILWAGVFGRPEQWASLNKEWRAKLDDPSPSTPAKAPLKRFHSSDCFNSTGEFERWTRTETDHLVHELIQIVLKHLVWGLAVVVWRPEFDEIVPADKRFVTGDAEGFSLRMAYIMTLQWAQQYTKDREIGFLSDNRPERAIDAKFVSNVIRESPLNKVFSVKDVNFGTSSDVIPLQVADLFAWEAYRGCVLLHETDSTEPARRPLTQLGASKRFAIKYIDRPGLIEVAEMLKAEPAEKMAVMKQLHDDRNN